ncbi:uncharacterized protein PHALS_05812 [Plasmopara halstedii]|uniref:Uncharacterized protein n=1 Tax=Plasmopara halstedii TaxID=4781 RepID=A0A0P1AC22_PLAHL|nr:uncharacterized protein PHALS_05812 [Plasmopara halstedii]CEG37757.1 hypothetical protein PHALS_05812 [Plasmopara halstedii]|eukprot:XP_024574126.1 hypothetical protein PHALS_05812 [Plasmopara halstedii]
MAFVRQAFRFNKGGSGVAPFVSAFGLTRSETLIQSNSWIHPFDVFKFIDSAIRNVSDL